MLMALEHTSLPDAVANGTNYSRLNNLTVTVTGGDCSYRFRIVDLTITLVAEEALQRVGVDFQLTRRSLYLEVALFPVDEDGRN